ncbi:MAG: glycosyltransferase [Capsulimonadales bacterium]|nr:glycosyltransferase [Capsulimonadales bacterium]
MRVLVVSHSCVVDVNQQVFVALTQRQGIDVGLLIPSHWKSDITGAPVEPRFLPEIATHAVPVMTAPVLAPGHITFHCYKYLPMTAIRDFRPDLIFSTQEPWSLSNLQALHLASRLGLPFLFQTNQNLNKTYAPPFSWFERLSYRRASMALAYSEEARQVMIRKGLTVPSEVVPYATDTRRFLPRETTERRRTLGIADATVVGYLGRLVPEKGLDTLIDAVARLKTDRPVKLLFVGAGPQEAELRQRIADAGLTEQAVFAGVVPHHEAAEYMACMDIFVLPSRTMPNWKEQFGRVIIEALACHVPVIGSDSGQIPHLLRETGGGIIFREGDADDLAGSLKRLIESPEERSRLAVGGARIVEERFTCEAVAAQLHRIFEGVLGATPSGAPRQDAARGSRTASEVGRPS